MNSTSSESYFQLFASFISLLNSYKPILIVSLVLLILLCILIAFSLVNENRIFGQLLRLLRSITFQSKPTVASPLDKSTIASPNEKGQFQPPIWCTICNDHVDHVDNLCPHVGQKFYSSIVQRRLFEFWRRELHNHYHPNPVPALQLNGVPIGPDCTIDLNDLINGQAEKSMDRKISLKSMPSFACTSSTPHGSPIRHQRAHMPRAPSDNRFDRIRKALRSFSTRKLSIQSSGIGSIRSVGSGAKILNE